MVPPLSSVESFQSASKLFKRSVAPVERASIPRRRWLVVGGQKSGRLKVLLLIRRPYRVKPAKILAFLVSDASFELVSAVSSSRRPTVEIILKEFSYREISPFFLFFLGRR